MIRRNYESMPTALWNEHEARDHLTKTFDLACKSWPDVMEPYVVQLADAGDDQIVEIMRNALRSTINDRFAS